MLLWNSPETASAHRNTYCMKPLRGKDTLKLGTYLEEGKWKEGWRNEKKNSFWDRKAYKVFRHLFSSAKPFFNRVDNVHLLPLVPPKLSTMAAIPQCPRRSLVSAIAGEWEVIVRLWRLSQHSDKQRDLYPEAALFLRKTAKVKVDGRRTQSRVPEPLVWAVSVIVHSMRALPQTHRELVCSPSLWKTTS